MNGQIVLSNEKLNSEKIESNTLRVVIIGF